MAIFSLFSRALPRPVAAAAPDVSPYHWNPGNYIAETSTDSNDLFNQIVARLNNDAAGNWKGVMIRKTWPQLEAGLGDYTAGFQDIDDRLAQISALNGRRLIVFIQIKTFGSTANAVPAYMRNSATYADGQNYYSTRDGVVQQGSRNGQYAYESSIGGPGGFVPNMHVTAVKERWEALIDAFATRFNGDDRLEAIVINEASIAEPIGSVGPASEVDNNGVVITRPNTEGSEWPGQDTWFTNMAASHLVMRTALENIQVCQWINGPRPKMSTYSNQTLVEGWVPIISGHGTGLGMTDLCINDVGFQYVPKTTPGGTYFSDHPGNIFLIQQFGQGNGIVVGHASAETYRGSVANRNQGKTNNDTPVYPGPQQTRQQTQNFAKNTVGVTHLVWAHNTSDDPYFPGMTMNEVTDAFIADPLSDITTVSTRPILTVQTPADAEYFAPLTHSLALTNGAGSPTLTRSTAMWVFDDEGKLINVPASAAAFGGARRVRNWFTGTDDMAASAQWTTSANAVKTAALDPDGNSGAVLYTVTSNSPNYIRQSYNSSSLGGNTRTYKFLYYPGTADWIRVLVFDGAANRVSIWFNATTNIIGTVSNAGTGWGYVIYDLSPSVDYAGWYELYVIATTPEIGTHYAQLGCVDGDNSINTTSVSGKTITLSWPQLEDTTGQTDKTPSEYLVGDNGAGINNLKWFNTHKDGTPIPPSSLLGLATNDEAVTNTMLYCRDFTNAVWVKTNVTAEKTQTGLDNASNSCSLLTFTADNATILQTITAASATGCTGWHVTRSVGSGNIYITRDNGASWTDITNQINSETPTLVKIENTVVLNPVVGFKGNNGDAIIVDGGINHLGTKLHPLPILTTSAAVTVGAQTLTYPKTSNILDQEGTILATCTAEDWTGIEGSIVGSSTRGLFATATGATAKDGTNTATGATDTPSGTVTLGMKYQHNFLRAMSGAGVGISQPHTNSLATDLTNISVGAGFTGHIKDVAIWQGVLADNIMEAV